MKKKSAPHLIIGKLILRRSQNLTKSPYYVMSKLRWRFRKKFLAFSVNLNFMNFVLIAHSEIQILNGLLPLIDEVKLVEISTNFPWSYPIWDKYWLLEKVMNLHSWQLRYTPTSFMILGKVMGVQNVTLCYPFYL